MDDDGEPRPYYLSPGQGGDKSGPYAPPKFTRKDADLLIQASRQQASAMLHCC